MEELDRRSVCRKTGVSPEAEMDVVTRVELECSYGAGDGRTRSGVASMPKERSGGPRLDRSCNWEKYGYDRKREDWNSLTGSRVVAFACERASVIESGPTCAWVNDRAHCSHERHPCERPSRMRCDQVECESSCE